MVRYDIRNLISGVYFFVIILVLPLGGCSTFFSSSWLLCRDCFRCFYPLPYSLFVAQNGSGIMLGYSWSKFSHMTMHFPQTTHKFLLV